MKRSCFLVSKPLKVTTLVTTLTTLVTTLVTTFLGKRTQIWEKGPETLNIVKRNPKPGIYGTRNQEYMVTKREYSPLRKDIAFETSIDHAEKTSIDHAEKTSIDHAERLSEWFRLLGVVSEAIHYNLPSKTRKALKRRFRDGEIEVLTSPLILTDGFDEPSISTVIIARPTKPPGIFQQMAERGLRLFPNKNDCIIFDFGVTTQQHFHSRQRVRLIAEMIEEIHQKETDGVNVGIRVLKRKRRKVNTPFKK